MVDLVIIGAGSAGLTAAAYALQQGLSVTLVEQNHEVGGFLAPFQQDGFRFDTRMPSLMNMGIVIPILDELGLNGSDLRQPATWRVILPRGAITIRSLSRAMEQLAELYPEQRQAVAALADDIQCLAHGLTKFFDPNPLLIPFSSKLGRLAQALAHPTTLYQIWRAQHLTVAEGLQRYSLSSDLQHLLGQLGYEPMSFLLLAGYWWSNANDYFLPPRGITQLTKRLQEWDVKAGAELRLGSQVTQVVVDDNRAAGVVLDDGEVLLARAVIAACDLTSLYAMLADLAPFAAKLKHAQATGITQSYVSLFLGVDREVERIPLTATHTQWLPDSRAIAATERPDWRRRGMILSLPSRQGNSFAPDGHSTLVISTPANNDWFMGNQENDMRPKVAAGLVHQASELWPELPQHIVSQRLLLPSDYQRWTGSRGGASAGWTMDPRARLPLETVPWRTPLPGLFLAGHWVLRPGGVAGAMLTARMAASAAQQYLHKKVW